MYWFSENPSEEIKVHFNDMYPELRSVNDVCQLALDSGAVESSAHSFRIAVREYMEEIPRALEHNLLMR